MKFLKISTRLTLWRNVLFFGARVRLLHQIQHIDLSDTRLCESACHVQNACKNTLDDARKSARERGCNNDTLLGTPSNMNAHSIPKL